MDENELHRNRWIEWSVSDLTHLEVNYRTMPLAQIADTLGSVHLMAHKLACQQKAPPRWTTDEDNIICQHFAASAGVAFIVTRLKDRTPSAIFARAE